MYLMMKNRLNNILILCIVGSKQKASVYDLNKPVMEVAYMWMGVCEVCPTITQSSEADAGAASDGQV